MPVKGWISVRGLPAIQKGNVKIIIDEFKKNYDLCCKCRGIGYLVDEDVEDGPGDVSTVKIQDSEALMDLHERGLLRGDVFRRIVQTLRYGRKGCVKCDGFGFVKKKKLR